MDYYALLWAGVMGLLSYLSVHVITSLIPAFFLAGAISSLFSKESVLRYFGANVSRYVSYPIAAVSGCLLVVCSGLVLPLFAGIYRRGAGIGPATTFLFSAPAINILAVVYTARVLGYDLGLARAVAAITLSVVIGLVMSSVFERKKTEKNAQPSPAVKGGEKPKFTTLAIFLLLVGIMVGGGAVRDWVFSVLVIVPQVVLLMVIIARWVTRDEVKEWLDETFFLVRQIIPLLLVGIFFMNMFIEVFPPEIIGTYLGGDPVLSTSIASVAGALMYFSTLLEVPIVGGLMSLGMDRGPALTILLAGPALSIPNMIVIGRIMKFKRTAVYILMVIIMAMVSGLVYMAVL